MNFGGNTIQPTIYHVPPWYKEILPGSKGEGSVLCTSNVLSHNSHIGVDGQTAAAAVASVVSDSVQPHRQQPSGSPIPGILQARTLEWVAISFSNVWKWKVKVKSESEVPQSYLTLSDPMDCSLPGSSIHGIFQARVLEWGARLPRFKSHWP